MKRNRFLPWFISVAITIVGVSVALLLTDEGPAEFLQQATLIVIPLFALGLMFLVFKSQT